MKGSLRDGVSGTKKHKASLDCKTAIMTPIYKTRQPYDSKHQGVTNVVQQDCSAAGR